MPAEPNSPTLDLERLEVPEGVSRAAFRGVLLAYAEEFNHLGMVPTLKQVYDAWPRVPQKTMAVIIGSPEFEVGCQLMGVPIDRLGGLSQEQIACLAILATPDGRTIPVKLRSIGVPFQRYVNWRKQPLFRQRFEQMTMDGWYDRLPEIRDAVQMKAMQGNLDAAKLVFAKTGEYDPAAQAVEDARTLVLKVMESVMKHVRDVDEREAIMEDIRAYGVAVSSARAQGHQPSSLTA